MEQGKAKDAKEPSSLRAGSGARRKSYSICCGAAYLTWESEPKCKLWAQTKVTFPVDYLFIAPMGLW